MAASQPANFNLQEFSDAGTLLVGGRLYTYAQGTTAQKTAYTDPDGTVPHTYTPDGSGGQYIALNARGELSAPLYLTDGPYDIALKRADGSTVWTRRADGVGNASNALAAGPGSSLVGFTQVGAGAVASTVQTELRRSFFTGQFSSIAAAVVASAGQRLFVNSGESIPVNVPAQFGTVPSALAAMANWIIHGQVTITVADGTYSPGGPINLNHPYGENINITGNSANPDACVFLGTNPPTFDMFVISSGNRFGTITGVKADLAAKADLAHNFTGFLALNGGEMALLNCKSNNHYYGVAGRNGGIIKGTNCTVANAGDVAFWAYSGANLQLTNCTATDAKDAANGFGFGYQPEFGGVIEATGCTATGCQIAGFAALSNGTGRFYNCVSNANIGSGFMSRGGGQIEANGSSSTNNTRYGIEITEYGNVINLATNTGNTLGTASKFAFFDTATGNARVAASNGQLRLDTNTTDSIFFNTPGGPQAEIRHSANVVNRVFLTGGAAGSPAVIGTEGEAVVDLYLAPKGVGSHVRLGAGFNPIADTPVTGYIEMKDNVGTLRRFLIG